MFSISVHAQPLGSSQSPRGALPRPCGLLDGETVVTAIGVFTLLQWKLPLKTYPTRITIV
jgi:hypothetical protein